MLPARAVSFLVGIPLVLLGIAVGSSLRPHILVPWVFAVMAVGLFQRGQRFYAVLALLILPLVMHSFQTRWGMDYSVEGPLTLAKQQAHTLGDVSGGSNIEYGGAGPLFFVSGFVALFFRPFPWQVGSLRMILAMLETYVTTALLLGSLVWMIKPEGRYALKLSEIQVAILATLVFCVFFSYLPNEGLIVRQRVQAMPALLALVVLPRWQRKDFLQRLRVQMQRLAGERLVFLK